MTNFRKKLPNKEFLHSILSYDNGKLIYKYRDLSQFKTVSEFKRNLSKVGKEAGWISDKGYYCIVIDGSQYMVHRIIYKMFYDEEPTIVDHINNCKTDNRIENLQASNRKENKIKSPDVYSLSGYRGVTKRKDRESYEVRVHVVSKDMHVGYYPTAEEAAAAYNVAVKLLLKDQCILFYLNETPFPEDMVNIEKAFFKKFK